MTEAIAIAADDVQARTVAETMLGLIADDGHVEVAQAELARLTGLSARTLRRALDRLREAHWIAVVREATPNAPARYDLTDLADVAQAVGLKPRREETTAVSSTGTGVLSAEVAADPIGAVQPGQRWLIDPTLLQGGSNIRADLRVGPELQRPPARGECRSVCGGSARQHAREPQDSRTSSKTMLCMYTSMVRGVLSGLRTHAW